MKFSLELFGVLLLTLFLAFVQAKPLEETGMSSGDEMMETAESQNPFLPRFAMKKLKEKRQKAQAQRRYNYPAQRRTHYQLKEKCVEKEKTSYRKEMKTPIILLLTLTLAIADPISKQIVSADTNHSLKCSDSETKHIEETISNKGDSEQKEQVIHPTIGDHGAEIQIPNVEVIVEEAIDLPSEFPQIDRDLFLDDGDEAVPASDEVLNEIEEKDPDEIMETAAGFVPIPIRKRQKSKKRFATRRHSIKRHPYYYYYPSSTRRSPYFFYPYYPFYHPSSLRYYY